MLELFAGKQNYQSLVRKNLIHSCEIFFNIFTDNFHSLFEICGKKIIRLINHPDEICRLPLKEEVKKRLRRDYKDLVVIDCIHLKETDAAASGYIVLENEVVYGKPFSKFDLGIIRSNEWVKKYYYLGENHIQKHFVKKQIIFVSSTFERKILNVCVRCYTRSSIIEDDREFQDLFYFSHIRFEGSPETLFDSIFLNSTNWCEICKITPLINIYDKYDCSQMYGDRMHNNANVLNEFEELCDRIWMEKIDDSQQYTYI